MCANICSITAKVWQCYRYCPNLAIVLRNNYVLLKNFIPFHNLKAVCRIANAIFCMFAPKS